MHSAALDSARKNSIVAGIIRFTSRSGRFFIGKVEVCNDEDARDILKPAKSVQDASDAKHLKLTLSTVIRELQDLKQSIAELKGHSTG